MHPAHILSRLTLALLIVVMLGGPIPESAARAANERSARVVYAAFGDSLTTCDGVDDPLTQCYPALLAHHLPKGGRVVNVATVGATIGIALMQQLPAALRAPNITGIGWTRR